MVNQNTMLLDMDISKLRKRNDELAIENESLRKKATEFSVEYLRLKVAIKEVLKETELKELDIIKKYSTCGGSNRW